MRRKVKKDKKQEELEADQSPSLKHLPGAAEGKIGGSNKDNKRGATTAEQMEKSSGVGIVECKEVRRNGTIKSFLFTRI